MLATWDVQRSAAWADGDVRRLESLYTEGSVAGERDAAMLRRWVDRGRVVTGLRMQVLSLREVSRTADRWVLAVADRVVGASRTATRCPSTSRRPARSCCGGWTASGWSRLCA